MDISQERLKLYSEIASNRDLKKASSAFFNASVQAKHSYCFDWLNRPIIQYPQDIVALQEIVASVKPDLIIETGIAHGGSLVLSSSLLCLLDVMEGIDPRQSSRKVIGVDIDIRPHNRQALDDHPLRFKMELIEGSSVHPEIIKQVRDLSASADRVLVCLDSNHTHEHVMAELVAYADLVSIGSYCVVLDTVIEDMPDELVSDRPWGVGNSPKSAVHSWLKSHPEFEIDKQINQKLLISVAPDGYLRRVS